MEQRWFSLTGLVPRLPHNLSDGATMRYLPGHKGFVQGIAFTAEGQLMSASSDGTVRLWDLARDKARTYRVSAEWVAGIAAAPDGGEFCTVDHEGRACTGTLSPIRKPRCLARAEGPLIEAGYSPDGRYLAWVGYTNGLTVWDRGRKTEWRRFLDSKSRLMFSVGFSSDSTTVATGGQFPGVQTWNLATGEAGRTLKHGKNSGCRDIVFSPDGQRVFGAFNKGVFAWWWPSGEPAGVVRHPNVVSGLAVTPDGRKLVTACWDQKVREFVLEPRGELPAEPAACYEWDMGKLFTVAVSADGMLAAAGGDRGARLVVWDLAD
jgi:WD40 repeat protein